MISILKMTKKSMFSEWENIGGYDGKNWKFTFMFSKPLCIYVICLQFMAPYFNEYITKGSEKRPYLRQTSS